jgi:hypothetical protein
MLKSTQFEIIELVLVTKGGKIDISNLCEEINIFDNMFLSVMSGSLVIGDSVGLSSKLLFDGSESVLIHVKKDKDSEILDLKKAFRIYKQTNRSIIKPGLEKYILHFTSDELIYSDQQRVNQSYEANYSKIVERILVDYLKVPQNNLGGIYEFSSGVQKIVIPNLRPLEAIEWCAKRALDVNQSPNFMFYQNITGFNFATLSTLLTQPAILDISYETKNIKGETVNVGPDEESSSINNLASLVSNATGYNGKPEYVPERPQEVKHATCSADKARRLLGYKTKTTLKEAVEKTTEYVKNRGVRPFKYNLPLEIINERTPKTWRDKTI